MTTQVWKNKHLVVAMLVAPLLAIIAYFATDYVVSEPGKAAQPGASYPLMARSNCRYASGECDLVNGDVKLTLTGDVQQGAVLRLLLSSELPLRTAGVALTGLPDSDGLPVALLAEDSSARQWSVAIDATPAPDSALRLVVVAGESQYYAEVPTVFLMAAGEGKR